MGPMGPLVGCMVLKDIGVSCFLHELAHKTENSRLTRHPVIGVVIL